MSKTPWLITLLRPTYGALLNRTHRIRRENFGIIPTEGPFLVIGNHVHTFDPMFISAAVRFHINWVAGRYLFKFPFLGILLAKGIGAIAKQQGKSDLYTIRTIREKLARGEVVGLFPEGTRTWDGDSLPVPDAMAKMIKMFRVPVVVFHIEGAFGARPRWAVKDRKGPITLRVMSVLQPEEFSSRTVTELTQLLNDRLYFSHERWQAENAIPYSGKARAEGVEDLLFACPSCSSFSTIRASRDTITCTHCSSSWILDPYDTAQSADLQHPTLTLRQWHQWESTELIQRLEKQNSSSPLFPVDHGILFQRIEGDTFVVLSRRFLVHAYRDRIVLSFSDSSMEEMVFDFTLMASFAVNAKRTMEFSYKAVIYRFRLEQGASSVRYLEHYHYMMNQSVEENA